MVHLELVVCESLSWAVWKSGLLKECVWVFYSCSQDASGCEHHSPIPAPACCSHGTLWDAPGSPVAGCPDLLLLATSLKFFLILDKIRLHDGKDTLIASFLHLLQAGEGTSATGYGAVCGHAGDADDHCCHSSAFHQLCVSWVLLVTFLLLLIRPPFHQE